MTTWNDLTDDEKLAHSALVKEAAARMHAAQAAYEEACRHLTPGGFPASWVRDSRLAEAQRLGAAAEAAAQEHSALLRKYER